MGSTCSCSRRKNESKLLPFSVTPADSKASPSSDTTQQLQQERDLMQVEIQKLKQEMEKLKNDVITESSRVPSGLPSRIISQSTQGVTDSLEDLQKASIDAGMALLKHCEDHWINPLQLFANVDDDNSGLVSYCELGMFLTKYGLNPRHIQHIFGGIDLDDDGTVSLEEFVKFITDVDRARVAKGFRRASAKARESDKVLNPKAAYVGIVAHNEMKTIMTNFVEDHSTLFSQLKIVTTGTTGKSLEGKLGIKVGHKVASGPLGGDAEIGELVALGQVAAIFFFRDPLTAHQHRADIEALTRVCDAHQVPYATNPSGAYALALALEEWGLTEWCNVWSGKAGSDNCQGVQESALEAAQRMMDYCAFRCMNPMDLYKLADGDLNGSITFDELAAVVQRMHMNVDTKVLFDAIHQEGTDEIQEEEFSNFMTLVEGISERSSFMSVKLKNNEIIASKDMYVVMVCQPGTAKYMELFVERNRTLFQQFKIAAATISAPTLRNKYGLNVARIITPGLLGGAQEIGAMVTRGEVAALFYYKDPMQTHGHAVDIEACIRLCDVHQVPYATNTATSLALVLALTTWGLTTWFAPSEEGAVQQYKDRQKMALDKVIGV